SPVSPVFSVFFSLIAVRVHIKSVCRGPGRQGGPGRPGRLSVLPAQALARTARAPREARAPEHRYHSHYCTDTGWPASWPPRPAPSSQARRGSVGGARPTWWGRLPWRATSRARPKYALPPPAEAGPPPPGPQRGPRGAAPPPPPHPFTRKEEKKPPPKPPASP